MALALGLAMWLMSPGALAAGHLFPDCENGPLATNDVCNKALSIKQRSQALVAALETDEKYGLLVSTSSGVERLGLPNYEWWRMHPLSFYYYWKDNVLKPVPEEALHGVASSPGVRFADTGDFSYATSFPQPILMGAAFDDELIEAVATVVSTEARAFNNFNRSGLDYWVCIC